MNRHSEEMTPRARAYLTIAAVRHTLVGSFCILTPHAFHSPGYIPIKHAIPAPPDQALACWGVLFIATGALAAHAAIRRQEGYARWALLASVVSSALWAAGFIAGLVQGQTGGPTGWVIWTAVTLKDITMLRAPMRNPFEPIVRKALADADRT